jgi:hypothetical protein
MRMDEFQADLVQDAHQKFIDIVADSYRDLDEFGSIRACKAFPI